MIWLSLVLFEWQCMALELKNSQSKGCVTDFLFWVKW